MEQYLVDLAVTIALAVVFVAIVWPTMEWLPEAGHLAIEHIRGCVQRLMQD